MARRVVLWLGLRQQTGRREGCSAVVVGMAYCTITTTTLQPLSCREHAIGKDKQGAPPPHTSKRRRRREHGRAGAHSDSGCARA